MKTPAGRPLRAAAVCGIAVLLLALTGCVNERTSGDNQIFTYEWWVPALMFFGGIAVTAAGWFTRRLHNSWPYVLLYAGPVLFIFMAPAYFFSKATLNANELNVRGGFFGMTTNQTVKFADLSEVHFTKEITTGRRGRKNTNHYLDCKLKDGKDVRLALSHDCLKECTPHFLHEVLVRKIPLIDENGTQLELTPK